MTRLADLILAAAEDKNADGIQCGALSSMAKSLRDAQHFEFARPMLEAGDRVRRTRPSTMVAALPMVRFPYRLTWFEWLGADVDGDRGPTPDKPTPQRMGVLVDCIDETLQTGFATWAWHHHGGEYPVVCPLGITFDNSPAAGLVNAAEKLSTTLYGRPLPAMTEDQARGMMARSPRFAKLASVDSEVAATVQLERRVRMSPTPHTKDLYDVLERVPGGIEAVRSAISDLEGEPTFLYALMILLNSRNVVYRQTEDLSRLNRARAKQKKRPLLPFTRTTIVLSRVQSNRAGAGADDAVRRRHLVMGHFKVRAGGVFWWSPHQRGKTGSEVRRTHYTVDADAELNTELAAAMEET